MASWWLNLKVTTLLLMAVVEAPRDPCLMTEANSTDVVRFPFLASIHIQEKERYTPYCCGTILNTRWVLTAGKCLVHADDAKVLLDKNKMLVSAGVTAVTSLVNETSDSAYRPERLVVHPQMARLYPQYDLGMIYLKRSLTMGLRVAKVPVPPRGAKRGGYSGPKTCTVVAWGATQQTGKRILQRNWGYTDLPLKYFAVDMVGPEMCDTGLPLRAESYILCTVCKKKSRTPCMGDIGAPLMCDGRQVGVVSWTKDCHSEDSPVVYTRINALQPWMDRQVYNFNSAREQPRGGVCVLLAIATAVVKLVKCV